MNGNASMKESLEKWLDSKVEVYKGLWNELDFEYEGKRTDLYTYDVENSIPLHGVVRIAEILGCCVKFEPVFSCVRAVVEYKGARLVESLY